MLMGKSAKFVCKGKIMGIYKILGVKRREPITATYQDVKYLNETASRWRARIRAMLTDHRKIIKDLEASRHVSERYALSREMALGTQHIQMAWNMYRVIQRDAFVMRSEYQLQVSLRREKSSRWRSA